jgi:glyoxylase-like metal-dependent hydrolase (beta-lactamase superfamily II)
MQWRRRAGASQPCAIADPTYSEAHTLQEDEVTEWLEVRKIAPGVHVLTEAGKFHAYLVEGAEHAALIDCGTGFGDIRSHVVTLTSRPVVALCTHGHWDHIGGAHRFEQVGIHQSEADALRRPRVADSAAQFLRNLQQESDGGPPAATLDDFHVEPVEPAFYLEQGQVIDLGDRQLQVWHTPGHSPGSVCLLDEAERLLFCGDILYEGAIYLHLAGSDPARMLQSYEMLAEMAWDINLVMPGHGMTPTDGRLILEVTDGLRRTLAGERPLQKGISHLGAARIAAFDRFMFFLPSDWQPARRDS